MLRHVTAHIQTPCVQAENAPAKTKLHSFGSNRIQFSKKTAKSVIFGTIVRIIKKRQVFLIEANENGIERHQNKHFSHETIAILLAVRIKTRPSITQNERWTQIEQIIFWL